ncbi:SMC-Scp complex subunit ScpB [Candidatus Woesearchaeota archaeon]|nr:SMC-Scp complex subunit ScpB [Candidatus Woesearchaeota archaeon]
MAGADLKKKVESILFAAGRAILLKELQSLLHINEPGLIKETIRELKEDYESKDSPLMILSEDEGWKLTVREGFLPLVRKINPHTELSKTIIETLAVIAWKQPALQSDVVKIRTNKAYDHIAELNRLGFIIKERHGRSFLVRVTQKFLDYFDLPDDKSIKEAFKDFKDIEIAVQKKAGKMKQEKEKTGEKSGKEPEPEEKVELESYIDVLPEMKKPKKATDLEVYDVPPEEIEKQEAETEAVPEKAEAEEAPEEPEETPEEKARRMAKELIGEAPPEAPSIKPKEEKKLHPELEEFIAGAEEAPEKEESEPESEAESVPEPAEEEKEEPEEPAEEVSETQSVSDTPEEEGEEEQKPKEAEEYPGQFEEKEK